MKLRWDIKHLYLYLVCFVMLITVIVGATTLIRSGIDLLVPLPGQYKSPARPVDPFPPTYPKSTLEPEVIGRELQNQKEFNEKWQHDNNFRLAMQNVMRGLSTLIVALPAYLYHWHKVRELAGE